MLQIDFSPHVIVRDTLSQPLAVLVHDLLAHLPLLKHIRLMALLSARQSSRLDRVCVLNNARVLLGPFIITIVQGLYHAYSGGNRARQAVHRGGTLRQGVHAGGVVHSAHSVDAGASQVLAVDTAPRAAGAILGLSDVLAGHVVV